MLTTNLQGSWIHHFDIRTKISGFCGIMVLTFLFDDPLYNLLPAFLLFFLVLTAKQSGKSIKNLLAPLIPLLIFIMLFTALMTSKGRFQLPVDREIFVNIFPCFHLYRGSVLLGLTFLIRIAMMVIASSLLMFTSPLEELIQLLQKIHVSYEVTFLITTAIRFIPTLSRKKDLILDAQKARGAYVNNKNIIAGFKAQIPIMIPLIINSILMADALSVSMLNRGFGYAKTWTNFHDLSFNAKDYWAVFIILFVVSLGLFIRIGLHQGLL
ncbi:MAG TPA: energy-coupling factor transporter transmembrane protein EcfT [Firmicutes bacterium]|jgi:energy-coupling factor transport system permease protein|nr:energy-coupling factor transporter transmembrane protein EcfT [Bacillota bacterium]